VTVGARPGFVLLATLIALAALGCGSESGDDAAGGGAGGGDSTEPRPGPAVEVAVTFWPEGMGGPSQEATLTCDPAGGTHPNAEAACALLAVTSDPEVLAPVPPDMACTMIFGGPEQATVAGVLYGKEVDAAFERSNGCELDRWDRHAVLLQLGD
jgi:Subtilisin inhibitor-like